MKKYARILQVDSRGQIVIPKDIRRELKIDESTGFFAYLISDEGIFLKKIEDKELKEHPETKTLKEQAKKVGIDKKNVERAEKTYTKDKTQGGFEDV